jgi:hypothetical protein
MAKGQLRGNKEAKKPKQPPKPATPASPFGSSKSAAPTSDSKKK